MVQDSNNNIEGFELLHKKITSRFIYVYGSLPKTSNTLNIRTPKIIAENNFKMFPKISNSGQFSEIGFLKF